MLKYIILLSTLINVAFCRDCVCSTGTTLNIRSSPSTSGTVLGQIVRDTCLEYISTSGGWDEVFFNGDSAYVSSQFTTTPRLCTADCMSESICSAYSYNTARHCDGNGCGHYGAPRGSRRHNGIDLRCEADSDIYAPFPGTIVRRSRPYPDNRCCNDGLHYRGIGAWSEYEFSIWYNKMVPNGIGKTFSTGDKIGTHIGLHCSGCYSLAMTDHSHFQLYKNGVIVNPTEYVMCQ
ncbi:DgyrCDS825 [Dimorphilus gyrociliatus]|uniref:DgyrCDS825 n=1 Tax=Dimorphilus gyrociliatus TaxID=2664684 RepID=A0A7I8V5H1_9ANNE|nr:DgyrCDS825 [Dimorphilus gyrociliatus]